MHFPTETVSLQYSCPGVNIRIHLFPVTVSPGQRPLDTERAPGSIGLLRLCQGVAVLRYRRHSPTHIPVSATLAELAVAYACYERLPFGRCEP
jgi:hypothetical protein